MILLVKGRPLGSERVNFKILLPGEFLFLEKLAHFQDFEILSKACFSCRDKTSSQSLQIAVMDILLKIQLWFSSQLPLKYYWVLALQMPGRWHGQTRLPQQENTLKAAGHKSHRYPPLEIRNGLLNVRKAQKNLKVRKNLNQPRALNGGRGEGGSRY